MCATNDWLQREKNRVLRKNDSVNKFTQILWKKMSVSIFFLKWKNMLIRCLKDVTNMFGVIQIQQAH